MKRLQPPHCLHTISWKYLLWIVRLHGYRETNKFNKNSENHELNEPEFLLVYLLVHLLHGNFW